MRLDDRTLAVDGQPVHLLRGGTGAPRVLLLHGWGSRAERYRGAFRHVPDDAFSVAIPDLPGFGATPPPPRAWGVREYAEWTRRVLARLGWSGVILIGHSFGGRLAIVLGAEDGEKLRGLILYAAAGVTPRNKTKLAAFRTAARVGKRLFALPGLRRLADPARATLYRLAGAIAYPSDRKLREIHKWVVTQDLTEFLPRIRVPTAILWGSEDTVTPVSDATKIHAAIRGSRLRVIEGAGHSIRKDDPALFAREIVSLVRSLTA